MTAEADLLPLPSGNVAHLIAAQAAEIEALRLRIAGLRQVAENDRARAERLAEALRDAATSMQTIADKAGRDEYLMTTYEVRCYANSRANAARALLRDQEEGK